MSADPKLMKGHAESRDVGPEHEPGPSEQVWFSPVEPILDINEVLMDFFARLASMTIDFDRMVRVGAAPRPDLAGPVLTALALYLREAGALSPALARRLVERHANVASNMANTASAAIAAHLAGPKSDQEKAARRSSVARVPIES
ncbi:MAG: hypothetical protein KDI98_05770 [Hyphomicrobiaceae bacterium]|nr:hypothetical protein [Hyphomicrobiaceae bacterium]